MDIKASNTGNNIHSQNAPNVETQNQTQTNKQDTNQN